MPSVIDQVYQLGQQLSPEERQAIIEAWQETPVVLSDADKALLDEIQARIARGEGGSYSLEESMAILLERRRK